MKLSGNLMDVFVSDVLQRNNIKEKQKAVSPEQKRKLREVVEDLQQQVNQFLFNQMPDRQNEDEDQKPNKTRRKKGN